MASPPVTFPCPFCGKRMGVPAELVGKQVRCPHCKQVITAPAGTSPPPAPAPVPPDPKPDERPEPELRAFNIPQRKEGADSILSEPDESDDEVFGSPPGARMPTLPPDPPRPSTGHEPARTPDDPFGSAPEPPPVPKPLVPTVFDLPPNMLPESAPANPFTDPAPPAAKTPRPAKAAAAARPKPAGGNPFADFGTQGEAPTPVPVSVKPAKAPPAAADDPPDDGPPRKKKRREEVEDEDADRGEKPTRAARERPGERGGAKNVLVIVLIGYALVATAVAVYGLFFKSPGDAVDPGHPLSTIPDDFGEFEPVKRKKVTQLKFPVDGPLPAAQRADLGGKIAVGQLEVQPKKVLKRELVIDAEGEGERKRFPAGSALVMILDIKNTSNELAIFPMDPAFLRKADPGASAASMPVTRLVVGKQVFAGGEIEWPLPPKVKKKSEVQQANDAVPLRPGESREYVVFTAAKPEIVRAALAAQEPLQWRVQVRRGLIEYKGKDVPVTAVIGVDFQASDIASE